MNKTRIIYEQRKFKPNVFDKYDSKTDRYYSRVIAGVGWPSELKPGAIVVVAEELIISLGKKPKLFWIEEFQSNSVPELVEKAVFYRTDLCIDAFFARRDHADFIRYFNTQAQANRSPEVYLREAHRVEGGLEYCLSLISDLVKADNKKLYLGDESRIPAALQELPDSVAGLTEKDFPLLYALGLSLLPLALTPYVAVDFKAEHNRVETKYDLFRDFKRNRA